MDTKEIHCSNCKTKSYLRPEETNCPSCGTKLRESLEEMNAQIERTQTEHTIKRARFWLLVAGILSVVLGLYLPLALLGSYSLLSVGKLIWVWSSVAMGAVILALWAWSARQPFPASVSALALVGGVFLLNLVRAPGAVLMDPLWTGFNLLVIVALVSGVRAAARHRKPAAPRLAAVATA